VYRKQRIPNYGVFDEARYFRAGSEVGVVDVDGTTVGLTVCEDLWGDGGPATGAGRAGARLVLNPNASPYHRGKRDERERWARRHAADGGTWIAYVNLVGGHDDVVYDGDSFVMAPDGTVVARAEQFCEDLLIVDIDPTAPPRSTRRWCSGHVTTWPRTASPEPSSACLGASTARSH
jgi:NAD+ synthase (glutamine-hydrolysing)